MYGNGTDCRLAEGCALHLHGETSVYSAFYSTDTAPGLVLAAGNFGTHLYRSAESVSTFLSRDGGWSWAEVLRGDHAFEFGDHGGLIVMAPRQAATTTLLCVRLALGHGG
jgi:hypothetical protein